MDAPKDCGSFDFPESSLPAGMAHQSLLGTRTRSCGPLLCKRTGVLLRTFAQIVLAARPVTLVKSQHNASLGSDESDQERKRQYPMQLQELSSTYQQGPGEYQNWIWRVLSKEVQNIRMVRQECIYLGVFFRNMRYNTLARNPEYGQICC